MIKGAITKYWKLFAQSSSFPNANYSKILIVGTIYIYFSSYRLFYAKWKDVAK